MRRKTALLLLVLFMQSRIYAVDIGAGDWLSGQNQILSMILSEERFANSQLMSRIIPNTVRALKTAQRMKHTMEQMHGLTQAARDYSFREYISRARRDIFTAFPEVRRLMGTVQSVRDEWSSLRTWDFKSVRNLGEMPDSRMMSDVLGALRTDVERMVGNGMKGTGESSGAMIDRIVYGSWFKTGLGDNIVREMGRRKIVSGMIERFSASTEIRRNVVSKAVAAGTRIQAEIAQHQSRILSEMNRIMKSRYAAIIETGAKTEQVEDAFYRALDSAVKRSRKQ